MLCVNRYAIWTGSVPVQDTLLIQFQSVTFFKLLSASLFRTKFDTYVTRVNAHARTIQFVWHTHFIKSYSSSLPPPYTRVIMQRKFYKITVIIKTHNIVELYTRRLTPDTHAININRVALIFFYLCLAAIRIVRIVPHR